MVSSNAEYNALPLAAVSVEGRIQTDATRERDKTRQQVCVRGSEGDALACVQGCHQLMGMSSLVYVTCRRKEGVRGRGGMLSDGVCGVRWGDLGSRQLQAWTARLVQVLVLPLPLSLPLPST